MSDEPAALIADLQAQIVALRVAVEGAWLSLLQGDPDPVGAATRLGEANVAAIDLMPASNDAERTIKTAVTHHTRQVWGSIGWQLANPPAPAVPPSEA